MSVLTEPILAVANMFAASRPFSRWLGLSTYNLAAVQKRIYLDGVTNRDKTAEVYQSGDVIALRPYVLIYPDIAEGYEFRRTGAANCFNGSGSINAILSKAFAPSKSIDEHWRIAAAQIGEIVDSDVSGEPGFLQMSSVAGYLGFNSLRVHFAGRTPFDEIVDYGDAYDVVLQFRY